MTKPDFRQLRRAVYAAKRSVGQPLYICRLSNFVLDAATGLQSADLTRVFIKRAVVLPANSARNFAYGLGFRNSSREFGYGGYFDQKDRVVIVDRRDVPAGFTIDQNDYAIFAGGRWEIKTGQSYEENEFIIFGLTGVDYALDAYSGANQLPPSTASPTPVQTVRVVNVTTSYSLQPGDSLSEFTNKGAVIEVDLGLPPWALGLSFVFRAAELTQVFKVFTTDGALIRIGNSEDVSAQITGLGTLRLTATSTGLWSENYSNGTWSVP